MKKGATKQVTGEGSNLFPNMTNMTTEDQIAFAKQCVAEKNKSKFYKRSDWLQIRKEVLELDHNECVRCKHLYNKYTRATLVHHRWHLEDYPQYALDIYVDGERNLISLCSKCHNAVHPEKIEKYKKQSQDTPAWAKERW